MLPIKLIKSLLHYILTLHQFNFLNVLLRKPAIYFGNAIKHPTVCFTEKCLKWASCLTWHSRSRPQYPPFLGHVVLNKLSRVALGTRMDNSILAVLRWRECRCCLVLFLASLPRWKFLALPRKKKFSFWPHKKSFILRLPSRLPRMA